MKLVGANRRRSKARVKALELSFVVGKREASLLEKIMVEEGDGLLQGSYSVLALIAGLWTILLVIFIQVERMYKRRGSSILIRSIVSHWFAPLLSRKETTPGRLACQCERLLLPKWVYDPLVIPGVNALAENH